MPQRPVSNSLRTFGFIVLCAITSRDASAQITPPSGAATGAIYRLGGNATYQQGCFPPCVCPVMFSGAARGTMIVTPQISGIDVIEDRIDHINWLVHLSNSANDIRITGSGVLHHVGPPISGPQRLELDLLIDNNPVQHFDSGWVPPPSNYPSIDVTISIHGQVCMDTVIRVAASPVLASGMTRYRLGSGSTFQSGCFPPCLCPAGVQRPMGGSFTLVPIISPAATPPVLEYAVVDARFAVIGPNATTLPLRAAVRGDGFYRRNLVGPWATAIPGQRMFIDSRAPGTTVFSHFDSGIVPQTAPFPAISIMMSMHGLVCFDTALGVQAMPAVGPTP